MTHPPPRHADVYQYASVVNRVWPSDYRTACVTVNGKRMCASPDALQIDGLVQDLSTGHASVYCEKKTDCSEECAAQWPEKEMKSACSHLNANEKSKHYDQPVPCGFFWRRNKLIEISGGKDETCALDVRYW